MIVKINNKPSDKAIKEFAKQLEIICEKQVEASNKVNSTNTY